MSVTPIRPGGPTQPPLPMRTARIGPEITRIYEVTSILELVGTALDGVSGDEDSVDIAMNLTVPAGAQRTARTLLMAVAERLQVAAHKAARRRIAWLISGPRTARSASHGRLSLWASHFFTKYIEHNVD